MLEISDPFYFIFKSFQFICICNQFSIAAIYVRFI